jgi:putative sugar O-methyltransferase
LNALKDFESPTPLGLPAGDGSLLDIMLEDMEKADPLYQPTNFWKVILPSIVNDLKKHGVASFRRHPSACRLYAPNYPNTPIGEAQAHREFSIFSEADIPHLSPHLTAVSESDFGNPHQQLSFEGRRYSRSFLNYLRGLTFLKKHVDTASIRSVLEIGGGYGSLGEILLKSTPNPIFYLNVDIPPVAFVATQYLQAVFGKKAVLDYGTTRNLEAIDSIEASAHTRTMVLCPWQLPKLKGTFDLFVNFFSFQEMEPDVVENYANFINERVTKYLLLRNQRDGKQRAGAPGHHGVLTPITRTDYLRFFKDFEPLAVDSGTFGNIPNGFPSEVMVLKRKSAA